MRTTQRAALLIGLVTSIPSVSAQIALQTWTGEVGQPLFGTSVAVLGDVDGDGRVDVAVGDPFGADYAGSVHVMSSQSGQELFVLVGTQLGAEFGAALAATGDLNHDGIPDLAVGAPLEVTGRGRVSLFSGLDGTLLATRLGQQPDDHFGRSLAGPGDVDGDGVPDVLVGAPRSGNDRHGAVHLLSGVDGSDLRVWVGDGKDDFLGTSVAAGGDLNGDGAVDLLGGAPQVGLDPGYVCAWSGLGGQELLTAVGDSPGDAFGSSVAGLGDVDGDGLGDFAVGVPGLDLAAVDAGGVLVLSGDDGDMLQLLLGDEAAGFMGFSVIGLGDVDGDGVREVVVGDDPVEGGRVRVFDGATGVLEDSYAVFPPGAKKLGSGVALAAGGDFDGDGMPDVLVGAPTRFISSEPGRAVALRLAFEPWIDLGSGLAGSAGLPRLEGQGSLAPGSTFGLRVTGAAPGAMLTLVLGFKSFNAPFKGGTMVPHPDVLDLGLVSDSQGEMTYQSMLPEIVEAGSSVLYQVWIKDPGAPQGYAGTNALLASVAD